MAQLQSKVTSDEFIVGEGVSIENNDIMTSVCKFLDQNLQIDFTQAEIKSAYKRGRSFNKTNKDGNQIMILPQIIIKVSDRVRRQIMKKKTILKGQINPALGCRMYINPNQPAAVKVARNRLAPIVAKVSEQNEGMPLNQQ